jgi:cytoskeleton protein RodZ
VSEPLAVEPQQGPGDGPERKAAPGFGYALAQTRVRAGLSVEQAAGRLRLHPKQLRAIEAEDLEALPAAAYVNGFVRNYARELGMDPGPLIEDLNTKLKLRGLVDSPPDLGSGGGAHMPALDDRAWRHLVLAGIVVALACAGLIGVWMAGPGAHNGGPAAVPPQRTPAMSAAEAPAAVSAAAAPAAAPVTGAGVDSAVAPAAAGPGADRGGPPVEAAPPDAVVPAMPAAAAGEGQAPIVVAGAAASPPPSADRPAAAVAPPPPGSGARGGLVLRFNDRSWVQVSRPDGQVLLSRNGEAGSMELLNAAAPLLLVVGRAQAVQVEYRGQPVNLKPYVNNQGVARLTLGDGHSISGGQSSR